MLGTASLRAFARDEAGAVTVDWVVLSAALVGLGFGVMSAIIPPMEDLVFEVAVHMSLDHMRTGFGPENAVDVSQSPLCSDASYLDRNAYAYGICSGHM